MASTYVNNLRLNEMATGDASGVWGTTTNLNFSLIGQALGYGTRAIANASTDNITIADGASDSDRAMYLKLTGGGQACTITLLPNTASKVWMMENSTSYTLTFTCGSGANVAILAGETKVIATDGAGSGGVVYDVLTDVNLAGTTKTAALTNAGALSNQGTVTVGVDDTGYDVKLFGATSGAYLLWDESADDLKLVGAAGLTVAGDIDVDGTTNLDAVDIDGAVQLDSTLTVGVDGTGHDVKFFGDTASAYMLWDQSTDDLILGGAAQLGIGTTTPGHPLHISEAADGTKIRLTRSGVGDWDFNIANTPTLPGVAAGALEIFPTNGNHYFAVGVAGGGTTLLHVKNTGIYVVAGLVATPAYSFTADTDTGMFRAAADTLAFGTGGTERLRIDSSGNVGIGNTAPGDYYSNSNQLVVGSGAGRQGITIASSTTTIGQLAFADGTSGDTRYEGSVVYNHNDNHMELITNHATAVNIDSSGRVTKPLQPAFNAYPASIQSNIAINTAVTVVLGTEAFDVGSNFASNTFTAPVTGKYQLNVLLQIDALDLDASLYQLQIITSNKSYNLTLSPGSFDADVTYWGITNAVLADMDASDTAVVKIYQAGGAAQADISVDTNFSGYLVC